ncbi:MAG: hypothetical protein HRT88_00425 [Lentisphaeraceae bacterium]|nr:hypothetical protein [Lentisphaeraceae bacterium]
MKNDKIQILLRSLLIIFLSIWFGGFLLYSSVVISAAHKVLKDHTLVGLITQQVTNSLNVLGVITVVLLIIDFLVNKAVKLTRFSVIQSLLLLIIGGGLLALFIIHNQMDSYIDIKAQDVVEWRQFYSLHKVYLIISTVQFFATLIYIPMMLLRWKKRDSQLN